MDEAGPEAKLGKKFWLKAWERPRATTMGMSAQGSQAGAAGGTKDARS